MASLKTVFLSSVGKKLVNGITGFALAGFLVIHLLGNLTLIIGKADAFNAYAHFLENTGMLLYIAELGLLTVFLLHILTAVSVWWDQQMARPIGYNRSAPAGDPSKKTISSRTMIYSGAIIFLFSLVHLITLKYGPNVADGYVTTVNGVEMRDLYRLTIEAFTSPYYTFGYVAVMIVLGFHLRHGLWSVFQSLGLNRPGFIRFVFILALPIATLLALGFLIIPLVIYWRGGAV